MGGPPPASTTSRGKTLAPSLTPGFPDEERTQPLLDYWRDTLGSPRTGWVLVTHRHFEHAGGIKLLGEATGARVAVGRGGTETINAEFAKEGSVVAEPLDGNEVFHLGNRRIRAIACPGHTSGTFCYLLEPDGILFTGDHIMGQGTVVVRTDEGGTMAQHIASLRQLLDYDIRLIFSGHGPAIDNPQAKVQELVQHRLEREEEVLGLLREGVNQMDGLMARIYHDLPERRMTLARHQVIAHLQKLEAEGRIVALEEEATYRLV